jgi:hypothetical protein
LVLKLSDSMLCSVELVCIMRGWSRAFAETLACSTFRTVGVLGISGDSKEQDMVSAELDESDLASE